MFPVFLADSDKQLLNFIKVETQQQDKPKKSRWTSVLRFFVWNAVIILLFIVSLLVLLFVYEDEVKAAVISELNKHLKVEVRVEPKNINLTLINTFPDCSIEFKDLLMLESLELKKKDTLLFARRINLHFNIKDLWKKNYNIHKIKVKDGVIKLQILKNGQINYIFWKKSESSDKQADNLAFDLNLLSLENCRFQFKNRHVQLKTGIIIQNLDLKGNFNQSDFELSAQGKTIVQYIIKKEQLLLSNKKLDFSVQLDVNHANYKISKAFFNLNRLVLEMEGEFSYRDSLSNLNLSCNAPQLDISSILSLLPEKYNKNRGDYESTGHFYAKGKLMYRSKTNFTFVSEFGIGDGTVSYKPGGTSARKIQLQGKIEYTNASSLLSFKQMALELNGDVIKGNGLIRDFSNPYLDLSAQGLLHLENLMGFLPLDTLSSLKGSVRINTYIKGLWSDLKSQAFSTKVRIDLDAVVNGLEVRFKGDNQAFAVESCSLIAVNREIEVKDLKLKRGNSDILLNGKLPGVFNYLSDTKNTLVIAGNLVSNSIHLEDFMTKYKASGGERSLIPKNIRFKLNIAILKFAYSKFEASAVTGEIDIKDQKAIISDVNLQTMDGDAVIDAFIDNSHNKLDLVLQSKLKNIRISLLFSEFNNFGQTVLQDGNLKGFASAEVDFSGSWSNGLEADYNSIRANVNLSIEQGELIDVKPLMSLSRFVDIQDLQHIRFSKLQSNIHIVDKTITFPKTEIKNSALNITMSGSHHFSNVIDYHIQLRISELLSKKRKQEDSEFGPAQDDPENKRSAFILMTGTVDEPIIKYDRQGLKEKLKTDIKQEKQTIKQVLKEEFGIFKKDTTLKRKDKAAPAFELEKPNSAPAKKLLQTKKKDEEEDF